MNKTRGLRRETARKFYSRTKQAKRGKLASAKSLRSTRKFSKASRCSTGDAGEEDLIYIYVRNESGRHEKEDANLVWARKHKNVSRNEGNIIPETLVT